MAPFSWIVALVIAPAAAWITPVVRRRQDATTRLDMAAVGIFFGTSTGNTEAAADLIYAKLGPDVAAEPVDIDTLDDGKIAEAFSEHGALIVGTPTWNTGADTERSGTAWDELYYSKLPEIRSVLEGKLVAVFGLGDSVSYSENYADATGELFDVFEGLGCKMMGAWDYEADGNYFHDDSKSIRGDKFCGLLLDNVNQEDLTEGRIEKWVAQLIDEGILEGGGAAPAVVASTSEVIEVVPEIEVELEEALQTDLEESSALLDRTIGSHSTGGFTPNFNPVTGRTMWTSPDGHKSFVTVETPTQLNP